MSTYHGTQEIMSPVEKHGVITISRVTNLLLMMGYAAAMVLHVVCLSVMAAKRNEMVDKFEDDSFYQYYNIKESCILFVDYDGVDENTQLPEIKWVNNRCHIVIYGSAALGGCALLMIVILAMKTLLFRK